MSLPQLREASQLPHSEESERAVLGGVLFDGTLFPPLSSRLVAGDFFAERNRLIFEAMLAVQDGEATIDMRTLQAQLEQRKQLDKIGGVAYLASLDLELPDLGRLDSYVEIVKERSVRRRLIDACADITRDCLDGGLVAQEAVSRAERLIAPLGQEAASSRPSAKVYDASEFIQLDIPPRRWLVPDLIQERDIVGLHAYRGVGKTMVALGLGYAVASGGEFLRYRVPAPRGVLFVEGELPAPELKERIASQILGANKAPEAPFKVLSADLQDTPLPSLATAAGQSVIEGHLADVQLVILDSVSTLFGTEFSENDDRSWARIQPWLLSLRRRGLTVVIVYHDGKTSLQRGTSKREDVLSQVIQLKWPADYHPNEGARFELHLTKARGVFGEAAEPFEAQYRADENGAAQWTWRSLGDVKKAQVLDLYKSGVTNQRAIKEELGIGLATVNRKLQELRAEGKL